jgi:tetratricopeptide (TPR) repeat protein
MVEPHNAYACLYVSYAPMFQRKKSQDYCCNEEKQVSRGLQFTMSPSEAVALKDAGNDLFKSKQYAQAVEKYEAALALDPVFKEALLNAGMCCRHMQQFDRAISYLIKAIRCDERYVKAYHHLSLTLEEVVKLPDREQLFTLCKSALAENNLLDQTDAKNLFFIVVDLKVDAKDNVKVLEFGDGMHSGSDVEHVDVEKKLQDMLHLPSFFSSKFGLPVVDRDDLDAVVAGWRQSSAPGGSQYCGVYGGTRMQPVGSDVLLMNKHSTSIMLLDEKVHMHELFHRAGMLQYRPVSRVYRKQYTPDLVTDICRNIPGDTVVVKNSEGTRGMGVLTLPKPKLDAALRCLLNGETAAVDDFDQADRVTCGTWMRSSRQEFIVEEYVPSKPVVFPDDRRTYDPAMRVVLLMTTVDAVVGSIEPLSYYWKFPKEPASGTLSRGSAVSSFDKERRVNDVSETDRAVVWSALQTFLPALMTEAFSMQLDEPLQSMTALSAPAPAATGQKSIMQVVLANALMHKGLFAHALYLIYDYLSSDPSSVTGRYEAAVANLLCGNYDKAIEMFKNVDHDSRFMRIAMAYRMQGKFGEASKWLNEAPDQRDPRVMLERDSIRRQWKH